MTEEFVYIDKDGKQIACPSKLLADLSERVYYIERFLVIDFPNEEIDDVDTKHT